MPVTTAHAGRGTTKKRRNFVCGETQAKKEATAKMAPDWFLFLFSSYFLGPKNVLERGEKMCQCQRYSSFLEGPEL